MDGDGKFTLCIVAFVVVPVCGLQVAFKISDAQVDWDSFKLCVLNSTLQKVERFITFLEKRSVQRILKCLSVLIFACILAIGVIAIVMGTVWHEWLVGIVTLVVDIFCPIWLPTKCKNAVETIKKGIKEWIKRLEKRSRMNGRGIGDDDENNVEDGMLAEAEEGRANYPEHS